jgi:hypothetical protein
MAEMQEKLPIITANLFTVKEPRAAEVLQFHRSDLIGAGLANRTGHWKVCL